MSFYKPVMDSLDNTLAYVATTLSLILLSIVYYWIKNRRILPGPTGFPYLGLYPFLTNENCHLKFAEYKKKYGDMFTFTYTGRLYINLASIKAMREVQVQKSDCFVDRSQDTSILTKMVKKGVILSKGERWKVLRKFFIQNFKEYGLNTVRGDLAGPVYDSLNAAIENLKDNHKNPVNIVQFLSKYSTVTMQKILFGENGATDKEMKKMVEAFCGAVEGNSVINLLLIGPLARLLFYTKASLRNNLKHIEIMKQIIFGCMKRIEKSMLDDKPSCIVEEFYKERNERKRRNDPSWKYFSDEALRDSILQFLGDGIASVSGFIAGMFNTLLDYPDEQEKLYSELIEVIGPNRQPTVEDRSNLPYANAFLNEYARTSKFLIFSASLECSKDTTVRGYRIPKGTITLLDFWSAHHDEETFEDPYAFKPSRYLHSKGKPKVESPVLFGMGKRICSGEPFVMLQSFLFLTTIVKNFKVVSSNAQHEKTFDFLLSGKLELTFVPRKEI